MLVMSLIAFAGLLYLAQTSQVDVLKFTISDLRAERTQLTAQNASLHAEATSLQSITRIDQIATTQLHMAQPDLSSAVWVRPVTPRVAPLPSVASDAAQAERSSQPLAWMQRALRAIKASL
jgi:cell division protein FtsL